MGTTKRTQVTASLAGTGPGNFTAPVNQTTFLNTSNRNYLRQAFLSQNGLSLVKSSSVVEIPMSELFKLAYAADPVLTYAPIIGTQPVATMSVVHPVATGSFFISASAETAISYQWLVATSGSNTFNNLTASAFFTGSTTSKLTISASTTAFNGYQFEAVAYNTSGQTTSSAGLFLVT
jgi:hypothetical protein